MGRCALTWIDHSEHDVKSLRRRVSQIRASILAMQTASSAVHLAMPRQKCKVRVERRHMNRLSQVGLSDVESHSRRLSGTETW